MQPLESLAAQAVALAEGTPTPEAEVARVMQICNACRYCEGFCAVFPAMTYRLRFEPADAHYLANLCHNCGACLHACQYAPPHEFAVNVPRAMAQVRQRTYAVNAWPAALGRAYERNGLVLSLALAAALALVLAIAVVLGGGLQVPTGAGFYAVLPHGLLVALFAPVLGFAALSLAIGVRRFWRQATPVSSGLPLGADAAREATGQALVLRYLDGGHGEGCHNADDAWTHARRRFHHLTFYGFMLCFAATAVATLYHYAFGWHAPYAWPALPKLLGVPGGVALTVGTAGLGWLHLRRHPMHGDPAQRPMDLGFIALLFLVASSGLGLWLAGASAAMPWWLCVHLGAVLALFATLPCGKFAHGLYRTAALLRAAVERRQPNPVGLGAD
ncbi:tricarballylate utilization 4Fe-4S protein TcuB [Ideonella alba]|uniref:Tricarballylate utilization 4Fe-4S protein TcuB n=1 Tax=Ideonella alba TaxID=2824118 RepID=A0A940YB50_9BURK|nr:tricarballylate utilization 4Fe-4S protein TcuB [Ideonella alba]MBQ0929075.1 tricarballylate utilization 4Fe-4S protein TcuB [Ideonella alba]